jgi:8-oxo-dGTP pyrophosphatase MutT (NUDIX family)
MFSVLCLGDWPIGRVQTDWTASTRRLLPEVESAIEQAWQKAKAVPGTLLFDGPMCRMEQWTARPDRLHLKISPCGYKTFFGTNMSNPQFGADVLANPVGLSAALCSSDGSLLFGRRNQNLAYYPGRIHPFAGTLEPHDADVFAAIRRELHEELSLAQSELTDQRCLGIVADDRLKQPEMVFAVDSKLSRSEIVSRLNTVEHKSAYEIPATAHGIESALTTDTDQLTPAAVAALLLWGRHRMGIDWYTRLATPKLVTGAAP